MIRLDAYQVWSRVAARANGKLRLSQLDFGIFWQRYSIHGIPASKAAIHGHLDLS
jgi:hypothetical protein